MNIPSLDFGLGEDINMLRDAVKAFADAEIAPRAAEIDRVNEFPADLWKKFGDMGLLGMTAGEEYGGTNMGYLAHIVALEEISRASASVGLSYGAHSNLCVNQIKRNGSEEQKKRYLPKLVSGDFVGNGKCNFSCSGICSGADCSVQREESADCGASCLWCSIYCRKNNGLCGVSITKCLQSARAFLLRHSPRNPRSISPSNTVVAGPVI